MYTYKVKQINRVIDGDTIDVTIDLGFHIITVQRVRLKGLNTAETRTLDLEEKEKGIKAKNYLENELAKPGDWIIQTTKDDKYGRILGTLYQEGDSITINQKMLNEGIAKSYME